MWIFALLSFKNIAQNRIQKVRVMSSNKIFLVGCSPISEWSSVWKELSRIFATCQPARSVLIPIHFNTERTFPPLSQIDV